MRSSDYGRVCANCKWWVPRDEDSVEYSTDGTCRRYPPNAGCEGGWYYPETDAGEWCGEFAIMRCPRISTERAPEFANAPALALGA